MANEQKTVLWWRALSTLAALNLAAFALTAATVDVERPYVAAQLALSGVYTAVCAFRSFLPRIDLERYVLVDSFASSIVVGRTAATVAEVSFAGQLALLLHEIGGHAGLPALQQLAPLVVVLLALAQVFCWSSVISLSHLGHAIEESLWATTLGAVGVALAFSAPRLSGPWATVAFVGAASSAVYVAFMVLVDVPMYVRRWKKSVAAGERRLGILEGTRDAILRREATRSWAIWRPEVAWLTGYFTFAVWLSLGMVHLPR
jgi:hypothetical protein